MKRALSAQFEVKELGDTLLQSNKIMQRDPVCMPALPALPLCYHFKETKLSQLLHLLTLTQNWLKLQRKMN